jgi:hypothetical protein
MQEELQQPASSPEQPERGGSGETAGTIKEQTNSRRPRLARPIPWVERRDITACLAFAARLSCPCA